MVVLMCVPAGINFYGGRFEFRYMYLVQGAIIILSVFAAHSNWKTFKNEGGANAAFFD